MATVWLLSLVAMATALLAVLLQRGTGGGSPAVSRPDAAAAAQDDHLHIGLPTQPTAQLLLAIADVHGDWEQALAALALAGVVTSSPDGAHRWAAGRSVLVQSGDVVDRGSSSIALLQLFRDLAAQAEQAGGRVVLLWGNHDVMLLEGDLRYFDRGEMAKLASSAHASHGQQELQRLLGPDGWAGRALREQRQLAYIHRSPPGQPEHASGSDGSEAAAGSHHRDEDQPGPCELLFVHAAALPWMVDLALTSLRNTSSSSGSDSGGHGQAAGEPGEVPRGAKEMRRLPLAARRALAGRVVARWNEGAAAALAACGGGGARARGCVRRDAHGFHKLLGGEGAVWSRRYMTGGDTQVCGEVALVADALAVRRVVVGHTIQEGGRASVRCGGRLVMADVGMSRGVGGRLGHVMALECATHPPRAPRQEGDGEELGGVVLRYGRGRGRAPRAHRLAEPERA